MGLSEQEAQQRHGSDGVEVRPSGVAAQLGGGRPIKTAVPHVEEPQEIFSSSPVYLWKANVHVRVKYLRRKCNQLQMPGARGRQGDSGDVVQGCRRLEAAT